jgi:hypothetical protein
MSGNGSLAEAFERITAADVEQRDLRQLVMDEMRSVRVELKALTDQVRDTGRAVDTLLAELRLRDNDEASDG